MEKAYPKDLRKAALPIFLSNSLFGIGVFEYPVGKQHRKFSIFYTASILIMYIFAVVCSVPYLDDFGRRLLANHIIVKSFVGGFIFLTVSSILSGWYRNKGFHAIIRRVIVMDETLRKLGIDRNYREVFKSQLLRTLTYFIIICLAAAVVCTVIILGEPIKIEKIMFLVVFNFPVLLISIGDTAFLNALLHLIAKLKQLNDLLKKQLTSTSEVPQHKNLLKKYEIRANAQRNSISPSADIIVDDLYTMGMARKAFSDYTMYCEALNKVFAFHVGISMAVAVFMLTGCCYHTYALLTSKVNFEFKNYYAFAIMGSVATYNIGRIWLFAKCGDELTEESLNTGDIIAEIEMYDENISEVCKTEIRELEMQLIQRPLRIYALGRPVNYTFLQVAIQMIATHVIILTQCGDISVDIPKN